MVGVLRCIGKNYNNVEAAIRFVPQIKCCFRVENTIEYYL